MKFSSRVRMPGLVVQLRAALRDPSAKCAVLGVMDQALVSAANFATIVILGRFGSQQALGVYSLALTALMLLTMLQGQLITAPYTVYRQRFHGRDLAQYNGSVLVHQCIFAFVGCFVLALIGLLLTFQHSSVLLAVMLAVLTTAPAWLFRGFIRYVSFANLQFGTALLVDLLAVGLQLAGLAGLVWSGSLSAPSVYIVGGIASAAGCLMGWWWWRGCMDFRVQRSLIGSDWRTNWSFARWALASEMLGCSTPYVLPWILIHTHGSAAIGALAACVNICGLAMMFIVGVGHSLTPQAARAFANGGIPALRTTLRKTMLIFAISIGTFCMAALILGEWVMTSIYGPQFIGSGPTVSLLSFSVLSTSLAVVAGNGLWAVNRPQTNLVADAVTLVVTIVTAAFLVGPWGATGAAAAMLVGNTAGALTRLAILRLVLNSVSEPALSPS